MAGITEELARICRELPEEKAKALVDFARFLRRQARSQPRAAKGDGDAAWERIIHDPTSRPKLDAFLKNALTEGEAERLDLHKL